MAPNKPMLLRFWEKVDVDGPRIVETQCWIWKGFRNESNYGHFRISSNRVVYAHRHCYELEYGPIPQGMNACHRCDNPPCVNPSHLFIGTDKDNAMDCKEKGRTPKGRPFRRLTEKDRGEIVRLLRAGATQKEVSIKMGISTRTAMLWSQRLRAEVAG